MTQISSILKTFLPHDFQREFLNNITNRLESSLSLFPITTSDMVCKYLQSRYNYLMNWEEINHSYYQHMNQEDALAHLKRVAQQVGLEWPHVKTIAEN